jgi:hypothetical protein
MRKYILFPGEVTSAHDGERHFIDAPTLARLYGVPMDECVVHVSRGVVDWKTIKGLIRLFPRFDGKYSIQDAIDESAGE